MVAECQRKLPGKVIEINQTRTRNARKIGPKDL